MEENTRPSFFEKANQWLKNSITIRIATITILILLLLIPVSMIQDLIRERQYRHSDAIEEVSAKWGDHQTVKGPVLTVPYRTKHKVYHEETKSYVMEYAPTYSYAHFLPNELKIDGQLNPQQLHRSIYDVVVYDAQMKLVGNFKRPDFSEFHILASDILWGEAYVAVGLSDLRGVREAINLNWNGKQYAFDPGIADSDVISQGVSVPVQLDSSSTDFAFQVNLDVNGSSGLQFVPVGRTTEVAIASPWVAPSFNGAHLPKFREVTPEGFHSNWKVLHLNRPYPQQFLGSAKGVNESAFGVNLVVEADQYQKSMRSAKYAVLFITLTFMVLFFVQIMNRVRIHPVQYIIVGLALCLFYTLLISLSEHIPFVWAYWVGSIGVVTMISLYAKSFIKEKKLHRMLTGIMVTLYGFIFVVIQQTDYALLMGSIGLFIALGVVMYLSRKIDWYNAAGKNEDVMVTS